MGFPEKGMTFEQARRRILKYRTAKNPNVAKGLLEQVEACEGRGAAEALADEYAYKRLDINNHSAPKVGGSRLYADKFKNINWS
jgi:hypothetical protein